MTGKSSKNQLPLVKASVGLGLLLLATASVFYLLEPQEKTGFVIPETKTETQAKKSPRSHPVISSDHRDRAGTRDDGPINAKIADSNDPVRAESPKVRDLLDVGEWREAEALLRAEIARDPQNFQAHLELARIHIFNKEDPQGALPFLEQALRSDPNNEAAMQELMGIFERNGDWAQALKVFNSMSPDEDAGSQLSSAKGAALLKMGQSHEAIEALHKAIYDGGSKDSGTRENLATAYEEAGQIDHAIGEYEQLANQSNDPQVAHDARVRMANAYISKGDSQQARSILEDLLAQNPEDSWATEIIKQIDNQGA